jgi:putative transposase
MPRGVRGLCGGYCYHVLNRGNGRQQVFYDQGDYAAFLSLTRDAPSPRTAWPEMAKDLARAGR